MKKNFFVISFIMLVFGSCRKDEVIDTDEIVNNDTINIEGFFYSNNEVLGQVTIAKQNETNLDGVSGEGISYVSELSGYDAIWFEFDVTEGEIYKVWWQDSWWEDYTAGSIWVTGFFQDTASVYFPQERLIAQIGSPKIFVAPTTGTLYIKIEPYETIDFGDGIVDGTFAIHVDPILPEQVTEILFDSLYFSVVSVGELSIFGFEVEKDSSYLLSAVGSIYGSIVYGDEIDVDLNLIPEHTDAAYFYAESLGPPTYPDSIRQFIALETGKVYLAFTGAYWWEPRSIHFKVWKE